MCLPDFFWFIISFSTFTSKEFIGVRMLKTESWKDLEVNSIFGLKHEVAYFYHASSDAPNW